MYVSKQNVRILLVCISFLFVSLTFGQTRVFKAQFKSAVTGEPIIYAKVQLVDGGTRLTNVDGYVEVGYEIGDRVRVTHLTYDTLTIRPDDFNRFDTTLFYLSPRTYQLQTVTFSLLGPRSYFDNKFVKTNLGKTDEELIKERLNIPDMEDELVALDQAAQQGAVLGSPISALYERYSKAGIERQKYRQLLAQSRRDSAALKKFDDVVIKTLTSYSDEEIQRFIEFCSFHQSYINSVDALELYYEILRCKDEYIEKGFGQEFSK